MGVGIRSAFDIGKRALAAQLAGLNVTGNNIANVNTEGYSRQDLRLTPTLPINLPDGTFGMGVEVDGIRRIRDNLIDKQLRTELHLQGQYEALDGILAQIETVINEPSETGLRKQMSIFFDNFHELANDPESMPLRFNIREQAGMLVETFHRLDEQMRILSQDIDFEMRRVVERLNVLTDEISELNLQIASYESVGKGEAGDLRDSRDRALDEISEMMEIFVYEKSNGVVNVATQSRTIIAANNPIVFDIETRNDDGNLKSDIVGSDDGAIFIPNKGKLGALTQARNEIIPHYRDKLNELADAFITQVNTIHSNGVGLQGNSSQIPKDINFFSGDSAVNIEIDFDIKTDLRNIAAATRKDIQQESGVILTTGSPGDNSIALEIADLKTKLILNEGTESLIDFFNSIASEVGNEKRQYSDAMANEALMIEQFTNLRDSASGVSLDEEFVNLIKYQRGYQASARVITTVDEMFQTLISMV